GSFSAASACSLRPRLRKAILAAGFGPHADAVAGAERHEGLRLHARGGIEAETPALRECGQDDHAFHPRERFAYALARAAAEGEIGEFRPRRFRLGREPRRVE